MQSLLLALAQGEGVRVGLHLLHHGLLLGQAPHVVLQALAVLLQLPFLLRVLLLQRVEFGVELR